jgi:phage I-like protein
VNGNILLVPKGSFRHKEGVQVIDDETLDRIFKSARSGGRDIPVDFGHESFIQPRAEAAGWGALSSLELKPDGLWGRIDWTEGAEEQVRKRMFRYLSPVFTFNPEFSKDGKLHIERLVSLGLTNQPNITAMRPLFNQFPMEEKMDELLTDLLEALGLPEETEPSAVVERARETAKRLETLSQRVSELKTVLEMEEGSADESVLATAAERIASVKDAGEIPSPEEIEGIRKELASLKEKEVADAVSSAITSGKILPSQKEWALGYAASDPEGFRTFLANSSTVVRMGEIVTGSEIRSAAKPIDEIQEKINGLLGISREAYDSYNV